MADSLTLPLAYQRAWPATRSDGLPERAAISAQDPAPRFDLLVGPAMGSARAAAAPRPLHLVLLLDTSGSTYGDPLEQTFAAAVRALGSLADGDGVTALSFNERCEPLLPWQVVPLAKPANEVLSPQPPAANGTRLSAGLAAGLQAFAAPERPAGPAAKCIVVVTDGATHGDLPACAALAAEAAAADCQLNFILVGEPTPAAAEELEALAKATRCESLRCDDLDLATAFDARRRQPPLAAALIFTLLKDFAVEEAWDGARTLRIQPLPPNRAAIEIARGAAIDPPAVLVRIVVPAGRPPSVYRAGDARLRITGLDDGSALESRPADIFLEIRDTATLPPVDPRVARPGAIDAAGDPA